MKIEKVSDNIIKVTITFNDLEEREIDLNALNYNSPAAQKLFWDMMERAEKEFGFDITDSQMLIESVPDPQEGFEITITRLDESYGFEAIHKYIRNRYVKSGTRSKPRNRRIYSAVTIYSFDDFEDICALSKKLSSSGYSGESSLYECNNRYFLRFAKSNTTLKELKMFQLCLDEYGTRVSNAGFFEGYLNEHGCTIIREGAIQTLSAFFG